MKKLIFISSLLASMLVAVNSDAQCYTATYGLWPSSTFSPTCNGALANITTSGYAGEYSNVNLTVGNTYVFKSSVSTDYITVDNNGAAPLVGVVGVSGANGITWTCTATGTYRFYTHTNASCGSASALRTRSMSCTQPSLASSNCTNTTSFGSAAINTSGTAVTISGCSYAGEYSTVTGAVSGQVLRFTSSVANDYITVRSGSSTGPVVGQGTTPLQFTNTYTGTVYVHWNTGSGCGSQNSCRTTTVQCMNCVPTYDPCAGIVTIPACGTNVSASMSGTGVGWNVTSCGWSTPGQEKMFQFTPSVSGLYNLNVSSISGGYVDFFWKTAITGGCNATGWNCIDDISTSGTYSAVTPMNFTAGTTYYILLDPEGTGSYTATFNLGCPAPPYNPCSSITSISACGSTQSVNIGAGNGLWTGFGGPFLTDGKENLFSFTPTITAAYPITVTNNGTGWIDLFWKNAASGCNSTGWTYVDDISGTATNNVTLTAGVTYYFLLDDEDLNGSTGSISIGCPCIGASVDGNYSLGSGILSISGTTVGACDDNALRAGYDRTYAITVPCAGNYTFSLCNGATWDTYMYLTSAVGSGIIASNDDACSLQSSITATLNGGTYYVTIEPFSDGTTGAFTLQVSTETPVVSNAITNVSCNGAADGSINITASGGTGFLYSIDGASSWSLSPQFNSLAPGTYTVVVKNCAGLSSAPVSVTITEPAELISDVNVAGILCNGGSTAVDITAYGGTAPYTGTGTVYEPAGYYSYTVTDANGCAVTTGISITEPSTLNASSSADPILCNGNTTVVGVSATGGTAPYTGEGHFTVNAGSYTYTVTDANGCQSTTSVTLTEPSELTTASSADPILCNGNSTVVGVSANGGTAPYSGDGHFTVTAGTYSYTVTDANGCQSVTSVTITEPTQLVTSSSASAILCNGGTSSVSVNASGGTTPYSGDGSYTEVAGTYTYTVTDANGCQSTTSVSISEPTLLTASSSASAILCNGGTSTVSVSANGGTTPYSGDGSYTEVAGAYTYTVTDANGCQTSTSVSISEPTLLTTSSSASAILCNGGTSTVSVSANGGTTPYSGDGSYTEVAGTYTYTVTDANGCQSSTSVSISEPTLLTTSSSASAILCNGGTSTVSVSANGGTTPYNGDGSYTEVAGTYTYTVTDANGCQSSTSITITEPTLLVATSSASAILCNGGNATVTVGATGGTAPYSGTGSYTVSAGTYTYPVSDNNGCTTSTSITVGQPTVLTVDGGTDWTVYVGYAPMSCATLTPTILGGTAPYTVVWSGGVQSGTSTEVCPTATTSYTVTVTDANGCVATDVVTVCAVNVTCIGNGNQQQIHKVYVCHNGNTLCVDQNAVPAHLAHGCTLGVCGTQVCGQSVPGPSVPHAPEMDIHNDASLSAYPNPFTENTVINISGVTSTNAVVNVYDVTGQLVEVLYSGEMDANSTYKFDYSGDQAGGIYFVTLITAEGVTQTLRLANTK